MIPCPLLGKRSGFERCQEEEKAEKKENTGWAKYNQFFGNNGSCAIS
jgi:hypothetical protein